MRLCIPLSLLSLTALAVAFDRETDTRINIEQNEMLFCKFSPHPIDKPAVKAAALANGTCLVSNNFKLNGCYLFPDGYGLEDSSWSTLVAGAKCEIFTDAQCKKDKFGPFTSTGMLNRQYRSYKCKCGPEWREEKGKCAFGTPE